MNTLELKNILISQISKIDDESFLSALKTILDSRSNTPKNYLEEYNNELFVAEEDIKKGNSYSHNQVKENIEEWKKK
jgi:hypothetical protein